MTPKRITVVTIDWTGIVKAMGVVKLMIFRSRRNKSLLIAMPKNKPKARLTTAMKSVSKKSTFAI